MRDDRRTCVATTFDAVMRDDADTRSWLESLGPEALGPLSEREHEILRLRFGLDGGSVRTREEVGNEFNLTPDRVRQIEAKVFDKLRESQAARHS